MAFKLAAPLIQRFELEETDKKYGIEGDPTFVVIRQATQEQNEIRQQMFAQFNRIFDFKEDDKVELKETRNFLILARTESYLTMVDCNILDENGNALFRFKKDGANSFLDMTEAEFKKAFGKLPGDIATEIHKKVREVNVSWNSPLGTIY